MTNSTSEAPASSLRQRMIDDMHMRLILSPSALANTIVSQIKVCSAIQSVKHSHRCEHDDTTAALITVPPTLLAIADEVIE